MENFGQKKKNGPVNIRANEIVSVIVEKFLILCLSLFFSVTPGKSVVFFFFPGPLQPWKAQKPFMQIGVEVTLKAEPHLTSSVSSLVSSSIFVSVACC